MKTWNLKYVAGNPAMCTQVTSCPDNPMHRSEALAAAQTVANNGGGWRVWVERDEAGERIFESTAEQEHQASQDECAMCGGSGGWPGFKGHVLCKPCNGTGRDQAQV
ncbi:hypothetical protein AVHM3334_22935 [Acidovorax sp. SUPP3334]|nr:hypothetical protein AVHM3334_22935 [Acidovorax sp. SUPP3334]